MTCGQEVLMGQHSLPQAKHASIDIVLGEIDR
jgi:hypothetical protein